MPSSATAKTNRQPRQRAVLIRVSFVFRDFVLSCLYPVLCNGVSSRKQAGINRNSKASRSSVDAGTRTLPSCMGMVGCGQTFPVSGEFWFLSYPRRAANEKQKHWFREKIMPVANSFIFPHEFVFP